MSKSNSIDPSLASELAAGIYATRDPDTVGFFLSRGGIPNALSDEFQVLSAHVGGRIINSQADNFGLIIKGKRKTVFCNDAFLVFRGTVPAANLGADIITDIRIGTTRSNAGQLVHSGFNQAFISMIPGIQSFLEKQKITGSIHCIGHSLGGAVATLAAEWISISTGNNAKLYTFGAPKAGFESFSKSLTDKIKVENIYRVYHKTDPVPMVPIYPYVHVPYKGKGYYYPSEEFVALGKAHSVEKYAKNMDGKSWEYLRGIAREPYSNDADIERWIQSEDYVTTADSGFWHWVNSALAYVIKKAVYGTLIIVQGAAIGLDTIADRIAYILVKEPLNKLVCNHRASAKSNGYGQF